jgi:hypothetical protein
MKHNDRTLYKNVFAGKTKMFSRENKLGEAYKEFLE